MVDVEHHDGHILVLVVKLPRLVVELSLHLSFTYSSALFASSHHSSHQIKRSQVFVLLSMMKSACGEDD